MHEMGLCEHLVETVERHAAGRPVAGVRVRLASAHGLDEHVVRTGIDLAAQGTTVEGAVFDLVLSPGRATCSACGAVAMSPAMFPLCPSCGNPELVADGEVIVEDITYRDVGGVA